MFSGIDTIQQYLEEPCIDWNNIQRSHQCHQTLQVVRYRVHTISQIVVDCNYIGISHQVTDTET